MGLYLELADKALAAIRAAPDRPALPNDLNDINDKRKVHSVSLADLKEVAGPDWPEVQADPSLLETLAHAVSIRRMREMGIVPPSYTAITVCAGCGPVPIFPDVAETVLGCPWCFNRAAGKPIPRPDMARPLTGKRNT